jgi:nuclear pore complex protein Nup205
MEQLDDQFDEPGFLEAVKTYMEERLFSSTDRLATRCLRSMGGIKVWLSRISDKIAAAHTLGQSISTSAELETIEYTRLSLLQQHEALAVILCRAVEQRQAEVDDFKKLMELLKKADRYDSLLGESKRRRYALLRLTDHLQFTSCLPLALLSRCSVPQRAATT